MITGKRPVVKCSLSLSAATLTSDAVRDMRSALILLTGFVQYRSTERPFGEVQAKICDKLVRLLARLGPSLVLIVCTGLSACGLSATQRAATITFGRALDDHGQLLVEESTYIRSEVKAMRVLAMSLPNSQSASLFSQGAYDNLADGVEVPKIERLVQIGGAASKFGKSVAQVADLTSSTASEKELSAATRQLALTAGAISEAAGGASMGGSAAVNLVTFISLEAYRKRYLTHALPEAEPAVRKAQEDVAGAFDSGSPDSLLGIFSAATDLLAAMLETSQGAADRRALSASDRDLVANGYRVVARNRDHIKYVTSRELELMNKAGTAYDALRSAFQGDETQLDAVESYSTVVFEVRLTFQSLK